jgi:parvulin-like peptidyl-prolyl isomerase
LGIARWTIATVLASAACRAAVESDPVLLTLGAESVRLSEFQQRLRRLESRGEEPLTPAVRAAAFDSFVEERVLALETRRRGLLAPGADEATESAAARKLLQAEVLAAIQVGPDEIARYYEDHAGTWHTPEHRKLSQILLASLNEARDVRRRLERDPKSFEVLARTRSRAPEAVQGGRMGSFAQGELPGELEHAAFALSVGEHSPVVESPYGFHVLRLDGIDPARERALADCQDEIRARLLADKSDAAVHAFIRELVARAKVNHEIAPTAGRAL